MIETAKEEQLQVFLDNFRPFSNIFQPYKASPTEMATSIQQQPSETTHKEWFKPT